jgi:hypothetical protein
MESSRNLLRELIRQMDLDLSGLTIYTEAASGAYRLTPLMAALAGAKRVYAQTRDSRFGTAGEVCRATLADAVELGLAGRIEVLTERCHRCLAESDIITNSGFVRPIDRDLVSVLKPTAVIPLMWETWEFRSADFDLDACRERGVLVLGTNEHQPPCNMVPYCGFLGLKLIFELGFDGGGVLVLGNAPYPAGAMVSQLRGAGIDAVWCSSGPEGDFRYDELPEHFRQRGSDYGILIVAEHAHRMPLLGPEGLLTFGSIREINPAIRIGVIAGNVDASSLKASGLTYLPQHIAPAGFMSYQPYALGPRPVLLLFAGGLKVGEAMARARLAGLDPRAAAAAALRTSPAMDFIGDHAWL